MIEHAVSWPSLVELGVREVSGAVDPGPKPELTLIQNPLPRACRSRFQLTSVGPGFEERVQGT